MHNLQKLDYFNKNFSLKEEKLINKKTKYEIVFYTISNSYRWYNNFMLYKIFVKRHVSHNNPPLDSCQIYQIIGKKNHPPLNVSQLFFCSYKNKKKKNKNDRETWHAVIPQWCITRAVNSIALYGPGGFSHPV